MGEKMWDFFVCGFFDSECLILLKLFLCSLGSREMQISFYSSEGGTLNTNPFTKFRWGKADSFIKYDISETELSFSSI